MIDPLGGTRRIRDSLLAYFDTAFRIRDDAVADRRRELLEQVGTLLAEPYLEPVPRYRAADRDLESLVEDDPSNPIGHLPRDARRAFVELALSGLFDGEDSEDPELRRRGRYPPYVHQIEMLGRGTRPGQPGVVTSGTGSGKTESFMMPILASLAEEAVRWPAPAPGFPASDWYDGADQFRFQREREDSGRPKAVRALILYPMNALVEDQMTRLRKTLDSPEATSVMDERFAGNRLFFGRYTGASPVTGHRRHPRDPQRHKPRTAELRRELKEIARTQAAARKRDRRLLEEARSEGRDPPDLARYLFPSVGGAELVSRWDMQETPPDILVTNASMLGVMLVREVEESIFRKTRNWLLDNDDARFFLVLDELHLLRGSSGTEISGMLRTLIHRLGLADPDHRHKLRILASSASLSTEGEDGDRALRYLHDFFGDFGTHGARGGGGFAEREEWVSCIVRGEPVIDEPRFDGTLPKKPFSDLVHLATGGEPSRYVARLDGGRVLEAAVRAIGDSLGVGSNEPPTRILEEIAARLVAACADDDGTSIRARSVSHVSVRLFGSDDKEARTAVRGLLIARGLVDHARELLSCEPPASAAPIRVHTFFRSLEGLFAAPVQPDRGELLFEGLGVERGVARVRCADGEDRRRFELLYCEACGDLFVGGRRRDHRSFPMELSATTASLEALPERMAESDLASLSYAEYGLFRPTTDTRPIVSSQNAFWSEASLDTRNGIVVGSVPASETIVSGHIHFRSDLGGQGASERGTALPRICPSCDTDYSRRGRGQGAPSPIRNFRVGFARTSQLLATRLFELLLADDSGAKSVVFSDSRQDAARAALDVERRHHQDTLRELVVGCVTETLYGSRDEAAVADLERRLDEAYKARNFAEVQRLSGELQSIQTVKENRTVPLSRLLDSASDDALPGTLTARCVERGIHPIDPAGIAPLGRNDEPWYEWFDLGQDGVRWKPGTTASVIGEIRNAVRQEQIELVAGVLFAKDYFALEETGLGYPTIDERLSDETNRLDAYLRVFADAYRVKGSKYEQRRHIDDARQCTVARINEFASRDPDTRGLDGVLRAFHDRTHLHGKIDLGRLHVHLVDSTHEYRRCDRCGRVHLHFGIGFCTRCREPLPAAASGTVNELRDRHFLARTIGERRDGNVPNFRLHCGELTGQTGSPSNRLRAFRKIFVGDESELARRAREIDLLSVTTTMEVGIDIGALRSVYQANMPPQRFNYQQRVGRAGRRGQAYSLVVTLCRSRSHDLHYFRHPEAITGDAPPPPFLTRSHLDIHLRILRKAWLVAAFARVRDEDGAGWTGDGLNDTHGEFVRAVEFYDPGEDWFVRLESALETTIGARNEVAAALAEGSGPGANEFLDRCGVKDVLDEMRRVGTRASPGGLGLGQFLAEQGLLPMYGMPSSVRVLYLGVDRAGSRIDLDLVDRDAELAVQEFAPGRRLVRDKRHYEAIGFSPSLGAPQYERGSGRSEVRAFGDWSMERAHVARCPRCSTLAVSSEEPETEIDCIDCGELVPVSAFAPHDAPAAYTTSFQPVSEETETFVRHERFTGIEGTGTEPVEVDGTNMAMAVDLDASVYRLNGGTLEGGDPSAPFETVETEHRWIESGGGNVWKLPPERLLSDPAPPRSKVVENSLLPIRLMARKRTNALSLRLRGYASGVDPTRLDRSGGNVSVRAAFVSATQLLVQRAAMHLDVDPQEFEALEPGLRDGLPTLRIADTLVNGSGFCAALSEGDAPPVVSLIESMVVGTEDDDLVRSWHDPDHRRSCDQACYVCLQRYGNRFHHGLLDWRLALAALRLLLDRTWRVGLDGDFGDWPELRDWPDQARRAADAIRSLSPDLRTPSENGPLHLPTVTVRDPGQTPAHYVMVHPLWDPRSVVRVDPSLRGDRWFAIDTFESSRRLTMATENAVPIDTAGNGNQ